MISLARKPLPKPTKEMILLIVVNNKEYSPQPIHKSFHAVNGEWVESGYHTKDGESDTFYMFLCDFIEDTPDKNIYWDLLEPIDF